MRQKWIPVNTKALVTACKKGEPQAQKYLYDKYAPVLLGICRRYIRSVNDAEDAMIRAFYKIMTKIDQLDDPALLAAWMKRIAVNEALMHLRRNKKHEAVNIDDIAPPSTDPKALQHLKEMDILELLDELPVGYRTVFNLYVIEGFKHREIAEQLGISINTSKSQLIMAKKRLRRLIEHKNKNSAG